MAPLHASVSSYKILSKDLGTLGHKYKMRVQEFFLIIIGKMVI